MTSRRLKDFFTQSSKVLYRFTRLHHDGIFMGFDTYAQRMSTGLEIRFKCKSFSGIHVLNFSKGPIRPKYSFCLPLLHFKCRVTACSIKDMMLSITSAVWSVHTFKQHNEMK